MWRLQPRRCCALRLGLAVRLKDKESKVLLFFTRKHKNASVAPLKLPIQHYSDDSWASPALLPATISGLGDSASLEVVSTAAPAVA
jgi:hypothetical protein